MAELVQAVQAEKEQEAARRAPEVEGPRLAEIDGRIYTFSEDEIAPAEALRIASTSRLVIWDSCGCGYQIWKGSQTRELTGAGVPIVGGGALWQIRDVAGNTGVFVDEAVRWGALR